MTTRTMLFCAIAAALIAAPAVAEDLTTVRLGEQESCKVTGVTTYEAKDEQSTIRFDVSRLGKGAEIKIGRAHV